MGTGQAIMQLSVPTLYVVIFANFLALGLVWLHFTRSYPNFAAARYWNAFAFVAAAGAAFSLFRGVSHPLLPILVGNGLLIFAGGFAWMGVRRFYGQPIPWLTCIIVTLLSMSGLALLTVWHDDIRLRILVYSIGQCIPLALAIRDLRATPERRASPGARLAAGMTLVVIAAHAVRSIASLMHADGDTTIVNLNAFQAMCLLLTVFAAMMANFGFVLMAIDRLRAEVAELALIDDLTGIANRRHFLGRLSEACARAQRTNDPFTLLIIDLDGFKSINDSHGHGAGDECLRIFTRAVPLRLRADDLFARSGGDEFCVLLPSTNLSDAALIARNLIKACRKTLVLWNGKQISFTVSVGISAWSSEIALDPQKLIAEADKALYVAKKQGRDRLAVYEEVADRLRETA